MNRLVGLGILAVVATTAFGEAEPWATDSDATALREEMAAFFAGNEVRHPGSAGNLAIEQKVAERFAQSGFKNGDISFVAPTFIPGRTRLALQGQKPVPLLPMHPTFFRPGNFTERRFEAPLVYLGRGEPADLAAVRGIDLKGTLALMEFNSGTAWEALLRFGIRGFIFIGREDYYPCDAAGKVHNTEVAVPRFFVSAEDGALLKVAATNPAPPTASVDAEPSRWKNTVLRDLWVMIPGSGTDLEKEVAVIVAPIDSNCVVPELATGAQSGANLYLLLRLLEEFKRHPPARSVMLAAVNAHTQHFLGERMLAWHLLAPETAIEEVRNTLSADLHLQELLVSKYRQFHLDGTDREGDAAYVVELRNLVDDSTSKQITVKELLVTLIRRDVNQFRAQRQALAENEGQIKREKAVREQELKKAAPQSKEAASIRERIGVLTAKAGEFDAQYRVLETALEKHVRVLTLFNKVGVRTQLSDLTEEEIGFLRAYVAEIIRTNEKAASLNRKDLQTSARNSAVREALEGRKVPFVINLELTWTGEQIGFCSAFGREPWRSWKRWGHGWGVNTTRIASGLEAIAQGGKTNLLIDTLTNFGGLSETHFLPTWSPAVTFFHSAGATPAFSLNNVYTDFGRAFTPSDLLSKIDYRSAAQVAAFVPALLQAILSDPDITRSTELAPPSFHANLWSIQVKTLRFDEFSAAVLPTLPVPGSVVLLSQDEPLIYGGDVIGTYMALTDERAACVIYGIRDYAQPNMTSAAFHFDDDFTRVDHAIDAGEAQNKVTSNVILAPATILPLFRCEELPIYDRCDSSLVSATPIRVTSYILLAGLQNSPPRKYGFIGFGSPLSSKRAALAPSSLVLPMAAPGAFYVEPGEKVKILTNDKRLALRASGTIPEGTGFAPTGELSSDIFAVMASDMAHMNKYRSGNLRGVSDELAKGFLVQGESSLKEMNAAKAAHDHLGYLRTLYEALGAEVKAYTQTSALRNDMLKAVIVYMALLLPFCFFVERLLFKVVRIEAEMALFVVLFGVTFIVFRLVHPAFRVAQYPAAILIAFVMGGLGLFVISILHGRFEGEMQLLLNTGAGADATLGYSTVSQHAMLIGISNMKRRRIRTALTSGTIVLITFTMLAFTSVSRKAYPTLVARDSQAPYTGIMFHWPGNACMDEDTRRVVTGSFTGQGDVILRRWLFPKAPFGAPYPLYVSSETGGSASLDAVLGLMRAEDGFLAPMPLVAGRFFSGDEAEEAVLPASAAQVLNIRPADLGTAHVLFQGHRLTVVGILDDERFRTIEDINGHPLLPIKSLIQQTSGDSSSSVLADEGEETGVFYADTSALLILPVVTAQKLGAAPYSISIRFPAEQPIWPVMDYLLTASNAKFHMSSKVPFSTGPQGQHERRGGVFLVGSNYHTSIGGLAKLIIPLLIASTIILNTMLGSVFERKREIAVYNAVGLNPSHIALFFLAESFVYGVIGSVGGYLIGQILAIALNKAGLVTDINLNFSSLSVAYVIMFTITVVLLSTIYPATVAAKAAVPSGKRRWSMPAHDGKNMSILFPFICQPALVPGIMAYLEEYFARYTEASTGDIIATHPAKAKSTDGKGRDTYSLSYDIALAPYDLGVTEKVAWLAAYDEPVDAYRISMAVTRVSGQDVTWMSTNKPYLEKLRRYLLNWRNLDAGQQARYVEQGKLFFAT